MTVDAARRDVLRRLADAHRARQAAARPARTCCCSTSRRTISISRRATGSRNTSARIRYAVILVSHDRYFLDAVVTRITDLNLRTLTDYVGNYSRLRRAARRACWSGCGRRRREQDEEVARVKMFIDRFRYQATKAAQVQSRIKLLEKVVPIEVPPEREADPLHVPDVREERPHGARAEARAQGVRRRSPCSTDLDAAHRARRSHRAGRPERRRQVDADAHAVRRGGAR